MKYEVRNRWTGEVQFVAEIECDENASASVKLGLAVKWGRESGAYLGDAYLGGADLRGADLGDAYLRGADLRDANLGGAYLSGTDLSGTDLIDGGYRSDDHRFVGQMRDGELWIHAGCRYFPIAKARKHWADTRGGTPLGDETMARLDMIEAVAKARGLLIDKKAAA